MSGESRWNETPKVFPQKVDLVVEKAPGFGQPDKPAPKSPAELFNMGVESAIEQRVNHDVSIHRGR